MLNACSKNCLKFIPNCIRNYWMRFFQFFVCLALGISTLLWGQVVATIPSKKLPKGWKVGRGEVCFESRAIMREFEFVAGCPIEDPHQWRLQRESPFSRSACEENWQEPVGQRHVPSRNSCEIFIYDLKLKLLLTADFKIIFRSSHLKMMMINS